MKLIYKALKFTMCFGIFLMATSCNDLLEEPVENETFTGTTDYSIAGNMISPLTGLYADLQEFEWENYPLIAVRGDDVNAGGLGDQQPLSETDQYIYNKDYWMYNFAWQNMYRNVFTSITAIEEIEKYRDSTDNVALGDQYIAEAKVIQSFSLLLLSRIWGTIVIPATSDPYDLFSARLSSKDSVMIHINNLMDQAIPALPELRPNERTDIPGGITRYTALAIKALANLELKNYQEVANATGLIISSGKFSLEPDYYNLFKIPGKLNNENIWELQYSDYGKESGDVNSYLYAFFGPENWTPKVAGAGSGWGFWEPSMKYIKFMLDRGETIRLETSVLFTNRGIAEIKKDPNYATLPAFVNNTTRSGDVINDFNRALFSSGKHYLPSDQLTPKRTDYGTNKNFIIIRYPEILLMYAEALVHGATGNGMTADDVVNLVRARAGLAPLSGVTLPQVMDEKYAELGMEWGIRYYDMVRLGEYDELSYEGRTFTADKTFLPYPQAQVDLLPLLRTNQ